MSKSLESTNIVMIRVLRNLINSAIQALIKCKMSLSIQSLEQKFDHCRI